MWVNEPPILEIVNPEEFEGYCIRFKTDITTWKVTTPTDDSVDWNDDIDIRVTTANLAESHTWRDDGDRYFVYVLGGMPAGLMVISEKRARGLIKVKCLAAHPGTKDVCGILVEYAVNLSEKAGYMGCLELSEYAAPEGCVWGFAEQDFRMKLVPGECSKWVKFGQEWRLTKHRVRSPLDIHAWQEFTIGTQIGYRIPHRNFGFLTYPFEPRR